MKKRSIFVIVAVVALLIITGCSYEKKEIENDSNKFRKEYESINGQAIGDTGLIVRNLEIPDENPFVYASANDIITMMDNNETFVVYFGFAECPWCRSVLPTLIEVANDLKLNKIYYVNVKDIRDVVEIDKDGNFVTSKDGSEGYIGLLTRLDNVLEDYTLMHDGEEIKTGEKRIYAPNVVSVVNGKAIELETGISDIQNDMGDPFMELTKEMLDDTYNKFECSIKCVIENKSTCSSKTAC